MQKNIQKLSGIFLATAVAFSSLLLPSKAGAQLDFCSAQQGFVIAGITVTNETTGDSATDFHTSFEVNPTHDAVLPVSIGDTISVDIMAGPYSQDHPTTWRLSIGGTSYEVSGVANGNSPTYSNTFPNFSGGASFNLTATQCPADVAIASVGLSAEPLPGDFSLDCTPATTTITAGSAASFSLATHATGGFNSPVTFTSSVSPSSGNPPGVSFTNNGATPSAVTTALVTTSSSTTPASYTLTFTGTGGGQTHACQSQLVVNGAPGGFSLGITPATTDILKGNNAAYTVTATCTGGFTGPVTNLSASSEFTGVTYNFSSTSVNCGASVTLTVGNTASLPANQLSVPQLRLAKTITVTGQGN